MQPDGAAVDTIDLDGARVRLAQSEERGEKAALASARPAAHAHERAGGHLEADAAQGGREPWPVAHRDVTEHEAAVLRPLGGRRRGGGERRLLRLGLGLGLGLGLTLTLALALALTLT